MGLAEFLHCKVTLFPIVVDKYLERDLRQWLTSYFFLSLHTDFSYPSLDLAYSDCYHGVSLLRIYGSDIPSTFINLEFGDTSNGVFGSFLSTGCSAVLLLAFHSSWGPWNQSGHC